METRDCKTARQNPVAMTCSTRMLKPIRLLQRRSEIISLGKLDTLGGVAQPSRFGFCVVLPCKECPILARRSRGCDSRMCGTPFLILPLAKSDAITAAGLDSRNRIGEWKDRKSTRLNSSHLGISYAVFCLKKKKKTRQEQTQKN